MEDFNISLTNHSNSSIYCKHDEPDTDLEKYAKRSAVTLIFVLGMFGNIFVILLAAKYTVRKNMHHLIINMAACDVLFLLIWLFINFSWLSDLKWSINTKGYALSINIKGNIATIIFQMVLFLYMTGYKVSPMTLLVISIERFRATRSTLTRSRPYSSKQRFILLGICWLIPMPGAAYVTSKNCIQSPTSEPCKLMFLADDISQVLLCFVILVLSTITMRRLSRPRAIQAHLNEQQRNLRNRRTKGAVRMVLVSVLLYMCCWLPFFVKNVLLSVDPFIKIFDHSACIDLKAFHVVVHVFLPLINSSFSPLIYIIFLPDFRQAAIKKVLCRRETQNQAPNRRNSVHVLPELHAISQNQ